MVELQRQLILDPDAIPEPPTDAQALCVPQLCRFVQELFPCLSPIGASQASITDRLQVYPVFEKECLHGVLKVLRSQIFS